MINKDEVLAELQKIIDELPAMLMDSAEAAMKSTVDYLHGKVPEYPPKLENQIYARTGTLGRQITEDVKRGEATVEGEMGLTTPYAPWVVGPDYPGETSGGRKMYQARVHQGRWWQFEGIYSACLDGMWELFQEEFFTTLRKRFAG